MRPVNFWILCAFVALAAPALRPDTIWVPDQYAYIQDALDAGEQGDTIIVRPGTYDENIVFPAKTMTLKSEAGHGVTIIDGGQNGTVVIFDYGAGPDTVLDGFTIKNGLNNGIYCDDSKPVITNSAIQENYGDGIRCFWNGLGTVTNNIIKHNTGDGISCTGTGGTISGNNIAENSGAGIWFGESEAVITNNLISHNLGGGVDAINGVLYPSELTANVFSRNSGDKGGAMSWTRCQVKMASNVVCLNTANQGGGVYIEESIVTMTNNTFAGNTAAEGGAVYLLEAEGEIFNTILWENNAPAGKEIFAAASSAVAISYSDVEGGQASAYVAPGSSCDWGIGMIDKWPRFFDSGNGDVGLMQRSPCRDAGTNSAPFFPSVDFEGEPRIVAGVVDIGADEFYFGPELPVFDIKCNGSDGPVAIDAGDSAVLTISADCRGYAGYRVDAWVLIRNQAGAKFSYAEGRWWIGWGHEYFCGALHPFAETALDRPLPAGSYEAWIGADVRPNGDLNLPRVWCEDKVAFTVQ